MNTDYPLTRDLVLVGGGHSHALLLRRWGMTPLPGARLTVVNPEPTAAYSGMLPGHIAGHYSREDQDIDLVQLCRFAGARLILGHATHIDLATQRVNIDAGQTIGYDLLAIDVGVTSRVPDVPGFAEFAIPAKPLGRFADAWARFLDRAVGGGSAEAVCIGGGIAGVELSLAMQYSLSRVAAGRARVTIVDSGQVLAALPAGARRRVLTRLQQAGVRLRDWAQAVRLGPEGLELDDGSWIESRFTVSAAGPRPWPWLSQIGLPTTDGYVDVDAFLRSTADPRVHASGDCAHLTHAPRPKAGVYAVRSAAILYHNLRAALLGRPLRRFRPQSDFLKLLSLGSRDAAAVKWGCHVSGPSIWRWKDRIDRRFMAKFRELPEMPSQPVPAEAALELGELLTGPPACGGCGAKVGFDTLADALAACPASGRPDLEVAPGDDAAILSMGDTRQVITTDHLRAFSLDPALVARVAAIHALGDIWAMGARPQVALASLILPRMTTRLQKRWLEEILAAATDVLAAEGAALAGGHTTIGAELTIGFTITGLCEDRPVKLSGARPGDALILTKPLGTGVLLAGEMRRKAPGKAVAGAWASMTRSQGAAAGILSRTSAMTDVTGFGLAGHALNMCRASGVGACIDLGSLPVLDGAVALLEAGIASTLAPANRAACLPHMDLDVVGDPRADLLFDPQTAGGLLAAVSASNVDARLAELQAAGAGGWVVGEIVAGAPRLRRMSAGAMG